MPIPDEDILDNQKTTLGSYLQEMLKTNPNSNFDIATAFFEVGAYSIVKDQLDSVKHFRLLLGKSPDLDIYGNLGKELEKILKEGMKGEVESLDLTKENETSVQKLIKFLAQAKVEVRLYEKGFLHGKAYIFDNSVVIGSSNFTAAGLLHNGELNTVQLRGQSKYVKEQWFEKFWTESRDFKSDLIQLLENSRFGTKEYTPYQIFIKALYELQKQDLVEAHGEDSNDSKVNLTDFQDDAITRIKTRLDKYGSVLIADSVGLGKTKVAAKIIEEVGFFKRKKFLVVCPAQLREMWRSELKNLLISEAILSLEDLGTENFLEKTKQATGGILNDIELVVVDESHNLRNPVSNRWENFFSLMQDHISNKGKRPRIIFMTATPINNSIWDLYYQIQLLIGNDDSAFSGEGIFSLIEFFKEVDKRDNPKMLNDLLNEISIRRTRDYIVKNYPNAVIKNSSGVEQRVNFPKRYLENVNYKLDATYQGLYKHIAEVLSNKLKMAYYRLFEYKKDQTQIDALYKGRMIALEGIFRTILLKRLESSVEAFRQSVDSHLEFLIKLKISLREGKLLTKELYRKYLDGFEDQESETDDGNPELFAEKLRLLSELKGFNPEDYHMDKINEDIDEDIKMLREIKGRVETIKADKDAKLNKFKTILLELSKKRQQIVVFTYYSDTLDYIFKNATSDKMFSKLRIEKMSGRVPGKVREQILAKFRNKEIDIIISTDVLSEGQNLQTAQYCVNYDLHWNPTRMIQRAGRIDRIGSLFKEIFVYNFFPEDELDELLELVKKLQKKIVNIDESVGLDQSILGEKIHPKAFGIIKKIETKDETVFGELEEMVFGGGEQFYQPLKDYIRKLSKDEIEKIPLGVYSGLEKKRISAIFFYYQYDNKYHYWLLIDPSNAELIKDNKTEILDYIYSKENEKRVIPNFFDAVYECNKKAVQVIEELYKKLESQNAQDVATSHIIKQNTAKFMPKMLAKIDKDVDNYLSEYPTEKELESNWDSILSKIKNVPTSKKRLKTLREIWRGLQKDKNWKGAITKLGVYVSDKKELTYKNITPFNRKKLKLVVVDFIS